MALSFSFWCLRLEARSPASEGARLATLCAMLLTMARIVALTVEGVRGVRVAPSPRRPCHLSSPRAWGAYSFLRAQVLMVNSQPVVAQSLTEAQLAEARELAKIIEQRSGALPRAKLPVYQVRHRAQGTYCGDACVATRNIINMLCLRRVAQAPVPAVRRQADAAAESAAELAALKEQLLSLSRELQNERRKEEAAEAQAAAARAEALRAIAAAESAQAEAQAAKAVAATAPAPAPAAKQAAPAPAPTPAKQAPKQEDKKEEESGDGGALGLLNVLGLAVGGGLGGYVFVLNNKKQVCARSM